MGHQNYETETLIAHSLRAEGFDASEDGTGRGTPLVPVAFNITPSNSNKDYNARESERAQALTAGGNRPSARGGDLIAFAQNQRDEVRLLSVAGAIAAEPGIKQQTYVADTLTSNGDAHSGYRDEKGLVSHASAVRRLTPRECERLQGFPDDYTLIPYRGKPAADGPRYKALGNSMAVPVMRWIGERIALVDASLEEQKLEAA
jgi:DNA (cytosine-5)-methyltransferase 1